jgi:UDP-GlcNAc:undecaprenyl-phosphate GlcNAc-1-phosphate transferase
MLIGLMLGGLALRSALTGPATVALAAPAVLLAVPLFDISMAVLRRKLTGQSVYTSDCGHLHHLLRRRGFSDRRIVLLVGGLCGLCGVSAWAGLRYANDLLAVGGALSVLGTLVGARWFGHVELRLLVDRSRAVLISLTQTPAPNSAPTNSMTSRLQGSHDWQCLWTMLVDYAERFDLHAVHLHISWPTEHEVYDAAWSKHSIDDVPAVWSATVPLIVGEHVGGQLAIRGSCRDDRQTSAWVAELIEGLKPFEAELLDQLETLMTARNGELAPHNTDIGGETAEKCGNRDWQITAGR